MNRLTSEKASAIAAEYVTNGFDKVKALLACGYSKSYARSTGLKVYDNTSVKAEIARMQGKTQVKSSITVDKILDGLISIAYPLPDVRVNNSDKLKALELLGRSMAMFTDNINSADITKQRELEAKEKVECERISKIRLVEFAEESLKEKAG